MFKLKFNIPHKLQRKVLVEKSGLNRYVKIPTTKSVIIMKLKRSISVFLCIIAAIFLAYMNSVLMSFKSDLRYWDPGERIAFLACSIIGSFAIIYYCRNHFVIVNNGREEEVKIQYLSGNWFKKLISIFIIYSFVLIVSASLISFCSMSVEATKMPHVGRIATTFFLSIITFALCGFAHHNVIKLFKIEI
jgi:hypothetical protein